MGPRDALGESVDVPATSKVSIDQQTRINPFHPYFISFSCPQIKIFNQPFNSKSDRSHALTDYITLITCYLISSLPFILTHH
jgi:hypothetical protein